MTVSKARWMTKKTARRSVAMLPGKKSDGMRALTYHMFGDAERDPFTLGFEAFERQLQWLKQEDMVVQPDRFFQAAPSTHGLSGKVLITIDDGHRSVLRASDVLERHGFRAIIFAVASWIGRADCLSAGDLRDLSRRGFVIGSHSLDHVLLAGLDPEGQLRQATESRARLSDVVGEPIDAFAYPYGTRAAFNASSARALKGAGYRWGFTSQHGAIHPSSDPLELPRVKVEAGDPDSTFRSLCRGGLDRWLVVDTLAYRLQAPPRA